MKRFLLVAALSLIATSAVAAPNFSGRWTFDPGKSRNVGMMAQASVVSTIEQTATTLTVDDHSVFAGAAMDDHTVYDLTGAPATNVSKMSGTGTTRSKWDGARLVTEWDSAGAIAGSTNIRIETRMLSSDGQTMLVESRKADKPAVVMAFDRAP
jgi:hypothetical protein